MRLLTPISGLLGLQWQNCHRFYAFIGNRYWFCAARDYERIPTSNCDRWQQRINSLDLQQRRGEKQNEPCARSQIFPDVCFSPSRNICKWRRILGLVATSTATHSCAATVPGEHVIGYKVTARLLRRTVEISCVRKECDPLLQTLFTGTSEFQIQSARCWRFRLSVPERPSFSPRTTANVEQVFFS